MTRRAFIGFAHGAAGLYVSPAGIDAVTADPSLLLLNMSTSVPQIIMKGALASTPAFIPLALPVAPLVLITNNSAKGFTGNSCFFRPWPAGNSASENIGCSVSASGMSFFSAGAGNGCNFIVVRQATP